MQMTTVLAADGTTVRSWVTIARDQLPKRFYREELERMPHHPRKSGNPVPLGWSRTVDREGKLMVFHYSCNPGERGIEAYRPIVVARSGENDT